MGFWDKFIGEKGGFWKRYWKLISVISIIYVFLTFGRSNPSGSGPFYLLGILIGAFGFTSIFFYIYYRIKIREKK